VSHLQEAAVVAVQELPARDLQALLPQPRLGGASSPQPRGRRARTGTVRTGTLAESRRPSVLTDSGDRGGLPESGPVTVGRMPHRPPLGLFDNEVRLYSLDELTETVRLLERSRPGCRYKNGVQAADLRIRLRYRSCGWQHRRLVAIRMLYLMFVRLAGWMALLAVVVEYSAAGLDLGFWCRHDRHPRLSRRLTGCW